MTPATLLADLQRAGVRVRIAADDAHALDLAGPQSVLSVTRLEELRQCKPQLLAFLRRRALRQHVAQMIRQTRRVNPRRAAALRDAWRERLAICMIDGGLSEPDALGVAFADLQNMLACWQGLR